VGATRNKNIISLCFKFLKNQIIPIEYKQWKDIDLNEVENPCSPSYFASQASLSALKVPGHHPFIPNVSSLPELVEGPKVKIKFQPAGHILGSAYVEIDIKNHQNIKSQTFNLQKIIEKVFADKGLYSYLLLVLVERKNYCLNLKTLFIEK
jgi:metallo-beta-lactamase family protein